MTLPPYPGNGDTPEDEPGRGGTPPGQPAHQPPPYGQQPPPYGQQPPPYGQQPPPYGQQQSQDPYGQGPWGGPGGLGSYQQPNDPTGQSYSGIAIAALVLSLTCVLSAVGAILGIVGLFRTGKGRARGRWMAVTAIVVGALFTLVLVVIVVAGMWFGGQVVTPTNAEAGQCVTTDREGNEVFMWRVDCDEAHDAEVIGTLEVPRDGFSDSRALDECEALVAAEFPAVSADGLQLAVLWNDDRANAGDRYLCYLERADGSSMDEHVLR